MTHHQYWQSIANMNYSTKENPLKPMTTPLNAIAPLLEEINTLKNENLPAKDKTESLVDLNKELVRALDDMVWFCKNEEISSPEYLERFEDLSAKAWRMLK